MDRAQVGIRELKSRLSHYLRLTKAGESVVITERGKPIGRIVPIRKLLDERLAAMTEAGLAEWSGQRPKSAPPVARARGIRTAADLVVEDRL